MPTFAEGAQAQLDAISTRLAVLAADEIDALARITLWKGSPDTLFRVEQENARLRHIAEERASLATSAGIWNEALVLGYVPLRGCAAA